MAGIERVSVLERMAEIDRELDALGKSDDALAAARARAKELAPSGLEAIDAALAALAEGREILNGHAQVETRTPAGASARPARWDEPAPATGAETGSGLVELPEEVLRSEALPPVLSLPPEAAPPKAHARAGTDSSDEQTDVRDANSLELELEGDLAAAAAPAPAPETATRDDRAPKTTSDARPLESLFDDAPMAVEGASGLDDLLFGDEPPAAESESLDGGESTGLFTAEEVRAIRSSAPPTKAEQPKKADEPKKADQEALDAALEEALDQPLSEKVEPAEMPPSGEFELMIDEDVLVLDDPSSPGEEPPAAAKKPTMPPPVPGSTAPPADGSTPPPPGKGFFSRILNRK